MQQQALMKFDPATGDTKPYPSHAEQWREWHGYGTAWLFNPWTGARRSAGDVDDASRSAVDAPSAASQSCGR